MRAADDVAQVHGRRVLRPAPLASLLEVVGPSVEQELPITLRAPGPGGCPRTPGRGPRVVVRLPGADRLEDWLIDSDLDAEPIVVAVEGNRCRAEPEEDGAVQHLKSDGVA